MAQWAWVGALGLGWAFIIAAVVLWHEADVLSDDPASHMAGEHAGYYAWAGLGAFLVGWIVTGAVAYQWARLVTRRTLRVRVGEAFLQRHPAIFTGELDDVHCQLPFWMMALQGGVAVALLYTLQTDGWHMLPTLLVLAILLVAAHFLLNQYVAQLQCQLRGVLLAAHSLPVAP